MDLYLHSPNTPSWRGAQLKMQHKDNFTFTFMKLDMLTVYKFCTSGIPSPLHLPPKDSV